MSMLLKRRIAVAVAVLVPLMLFAWGYQKFQRPAKPDGKAAGMERKLRSQKPEIVVLGSSLARTNVDSEQLAKELGISRKHVVMMTLPNATAAHWYAMMKNRVFANGHRPKVVVMVGALTTMITPDVLMNTSSGRLVNQLTTYEPVIAKKVFGREGQADFKYLYMREQAGQARDEFLASYRDIALSIIFSKKGGAADGEKLAERANSTVFADERMDYTLHSEQSTGLYVGSVDEIVLEGLDVATESLIPDIGQLAREFDAHAVFVRTPFPPSNSDNDLVAPRMEEETLAVMEASEAGYVDLRSLNLDDSYFQDMRHMSKEGAALFTKALARSIQAMGVLDKNGHAQIRTGITPARIERTGTPPDLAGLLAEGELAGRCAMILPAGPLAGLEVEGMARAGQARATPVRIGRGGEDLPWFAEPRSGCTPSVTFDESGIRIVPNRKGDFDGVTLSLVEEVPFEVEEEELPAYWVYPGTSLRFVFDETWPFSADSFRFFMLGHAFGGSGGQAEFVLGEQSLPVERLGGRVWGSFQPDPPTEDEWAFEIRVPEDGPFLLLQNLAMGSMPQTAHLVGVPELLAGGSIRIVGGKVEDTELDPSFKAPPPKLGVNPRVRKAPRGLGIMAVPAFSSLADAPTSRASVPHKCSPFRVLEGGEPLTDPWATCLDVADLKGGRSCHAGNVIYFAASDSTVPANNGRKYSLSLDETRVCDRRNQRNTTPLRGALWLYPGDHLTLTFPPDKLQEFYDGANKLEIEVENPILRVGDVLDVRLLVNGETLVEQRIEPPSARRRTEVLSFEPPLPPRVRDVKLEFRNASTRSYWLLLMATLSEDYDYGFSPVRDRLIGEPQEAMALLEDGDMFGEELDDPFAEDLVFDGERAPIESVRTGPMPELPPMKDLKNLKDGMIEGHLFSLWPISNSVLAKAGLAWWSPIRVVDNEVPMRGATTRKEFKEGCDGCFIHIGQAIVVRPSDPEKIDGVEVSLAEEIPVPTVVGDSIWWIYPSTGARVTVPGGWKGDSMTLTVRVATFTHDKNDGWEPPVLRVGEQEVVFEPAEKLWQAEVVIDRRETASWSFEIDAPAGGPFLLVHQAWLTDDAGTWEIVAPPVATMPVEADWQE